MSWGSRSIVKMESSLLNYVARGLRGTMEDLKEESKIRPDKPDFCSAMNVFRRIEKVRKDMDTYVELGIPSQDSEYLEKIDLYIKTSLKNLNELEGLLK